MKLRTIETAVIVLRARLYVVFYDLMRTWRYCDIQRCHVASAGEQHGQIPIYGYVCPI